MNAILRVGLIFVCVGACLTKAEEKVVRVNAPRELRLAIVDSAKPSVAREQVYAAFGQTLSAALSAKCGEHVGVRVKRADADNAAFSLGTGVYDAVLVLGHSLPRPLIISDLTRLSATLGAGKKETKMFLIFSKGDAGLADLLTSTFSVALTADKFLNAFDGPEPKIDGGSKLAAAD